MSAFKKWRDQHAQDKEKDMRMEAGLVFCEAVGLKWEEAKEKWRDPMYPPTQEQVEALKRFGEPPPDESIGLNNRCGYTVIVNACIRQAQNRRPARIWPSTEALLRAKEKDAKGEFEDFKELRSSIKATRTEAIAKLGGQCNECGEFDPAVLEIDHLYDDGATHRKMSTGRGPAFYADVVEHGRAFYQLLCGTHHNKKTAEARERAKVDK